MNNAAAAAVPLRPDPIGWLAVLMAAALLVPHLAGCSSVHFDPALSPATTSTTTVSADQTEATGGAAGGRCGRTRRRG